MTVTLAGLVVEKMAVDDTASDSSCSKQSFMIETPPQMRRKRKKKSTKSLMSASFADLYKMTGESLGEGSYGRVESCKNVFTGIEYAVKIIEKRPGSFNRSKRLRFIIFVEDKETSSS